MFSNKIIDTLFWYKGEINERSYRAMLILILIFVNTSLLPLIQALLVRPETGIGHSFMTYTSNPLFCFYMFLMLYSTFVISIKRARAKSLPPALGWIIGFFTYLTFWMWSKFLAYLIESSTFRSFEYSIIIPATIVIVFIGIIIMIYMGRKCDYDYENDSFEEEMRFSGITYLLKIWNVGLIAAGVRIILSFAGEQSNFVKISSLILGLLYVGLLLSYAFRRASDANVSYLWIILALPSIIILEVIYYYTGSTYATFMVECIFFMRFVLIILPSADKKENQEYGLSE